MSPKICQALYSESEKAGSIISIGDLPTTNIIEPEIVQNLAMIGFFEKYGIIVVI